MKWPDPTFSVNVDVTNPGQFFACCGLLELAHRLWPGTEGWFENGRFFLAAGNARTDLSDLLTPVVKCDVKPIPNSADDPKIEALAIGDPINMRLDWWLGQNKKPNLFKTWAANATSRQMFCKWRRSLEKNIDRLATQPEEVLTVTERMQGSYGFDSDLSWNALDVGFSLNEHARLKCLPTHPAVEMIGAIGLQRFFPILETREQVVRYVTWHAPLAAPVARVAAIGAFPVVRTESFCTRVVYRGKFKGLNTARRSL